MAALVLALSPAVAAGLTTTSPEVQATVDRGIKFLESDAAKDDRIGAVALVGLSLLKHDDNRDHPKIVEAVSKIEQALGARDPAKLNKSGFDMYSTGLAIIFLVELDPAQYRADIECLLENLHLRQKPHGGWGYDERETGDTSMTQYGVLSSWEAMQAGIDVPMESIESVMNWLLHTQDPSGGFGYQGNLSKDAALVAQSEVRSSMTAAGLGSVYICSTMLGLVDKTERRRGALPPAVKEITPKEGGKEKAEIQVADRCQAGARGGEPWKPMAGEELQDGPAGLYALLPLRLRAVHELSGVLRKERREGAAMVRRRRPLPDQDPGAPTEAGAAGAGRCRIPRLACSFCCVR